MNNKFELSETRDSYKVFFNDGSFFLISAEDLPRIAKYSWCKGKRGYPVSHKSRKSPEGNKNITLHRFLLNPPKGYDIDHISGDKLDNRRENLRICTHQQNTFNQRLRNTNSSGFYGVSYCKAAGKYEAYIHVDAKKHYLGIYDSAKEAADVRDRAAIRYFGAFAKLNRDLEGYAA